MTEKNNLFQIGFLKEPEPTLRSNHTSTKTPSFFNKPKDKASMSLYTFKNSDSSIKTGKLAKSRRKIRKTLPLPNSISYAEKITESLQTIPQDSKTKFVNSQYRS